MWWRATSSIWLASCSFLALLAAGGCAPRPRIALPGNQFRITEIGGRALTLSPPAANLSRDARLEIQFPIARGRGSSKDCVEANDLFRVSIVKRTLSLSMPSLEKWQYILQYWELPDQRMEPKVMTVLNAPETLESRGCLSPGSAFDLRQILRDVVPMRPGYDLYTTYGYRPGGLGLELKPGVRVKIHRAHFNGPPPADGKRTITDLNGMTAVYYEVKEDSRRDISFSKPRVAFENAAVRRSVNQGWDDDKVLSRTRPRPVYRLFLLTSFLKTGMRRSALILGAPTVARMQAMERQIAANPAIDCSELEPAACVSFEGDVSVSAEVEVLINGAKAYADWGSSVHTLMIKYKAPANAVAQLRRRFQGKLVPFVSDTKAADAIQNTVLIAGDELSWQ